MSQFLGRKRDCLWPTIAAAVVLVLTAAGVFGLGRAFLLSRPAVAVAELTLTEPLASANGTDAPTPLQLKAIERWVAAQASDDPPAESVLDRAFGSAVGPTSNDLAARSHSENAAANTSLPADAAAPPADELPTGLPTADSETLATDSADSASSDPLASKLDELGLPSALTPEDDSNRAWLTVRAEYAAAQHAVAVMLTARAPQADLASSTAEKAAKRYASYAAQRWFREAQVADTQAEAELLAAKKDLKSAENRLAEAIQKKEAFEAAAEQATETAWPPNSNPATADRPTAGQSNSEQIPHQPKAEPDEPVERLSLGRQIEVLKLRRTCLLWQLTPKHPRIESIDHQIAELESQLAEFPPDSPLIWSVEGATPNDAGASGETPAPANKVAGAPPLHGSDNRGTAGTQDPNGAATNATASTAPETDAQQLSAELARAAAALEHAEKRVEQAEQRRQLCRFALNNPPQSTLGPLRVSDPNQLFHMLARWPLAALAGGKAILLAALTYVLMTVWARRRRAAVVVTSVEQLQQLSPLPVFALAAAGSGRS